ncbi:MAG TPA: TRAP transporter large permease subunit [Myxococcales bacterium]|nr:TRAP transporter large permease subunit [Myxococcales bacterium]
MDPLSGGPSISAPKQRGPIAWLDFGTYQVERGITWIALLVMAITYFLDIVEREFTAGPGQNAVERFVLERMGKTAETVDPVFLDALHSLWGPLILVGSILLLLLAAAFTIREENGERPENNKGWLSFFSIATLCTLGFIAALLYIPSTWFCVFIVTGSFAWGLYSIRNGDQVKRTALTWGPAVALILWFVFSCIESEYNWSKDLAKMLLMWVGFIGASMATYEGRNIQVDFVRKNVPKAWLRIYEIIGSLITVVFTLILAALAYDTVRRGMANPVKMPNIEISDYLVPLPVALGFILIALRYLLRSGRLILDTEPLPLEEAPEGKNRFLIISGILVGLMLLSLFGMSKIGAGIVITLLVMLLVGAPLFVVIGALAVACFAVWPQVTDYMSSFEAFNQNFNLMARMVDLADQESLIAIPFFMVAGAVMSRGAIARQLVECASSMFGWLPGGLAISAIMACMFFAAISGSSPVTVITIGAIMLPALVKAGYDEKFSLGLVTSAGSLGIIIPPSIPMIIYAIFATLNKTPVNIKDLFIAGIGPGIVIAISLSVVCVYKGISIPREKFEIKRILRSFYDGFWALFLPFFILIGIYFGIFNAIEASAIAVILALVIELFIHRQLKVTELPAVLADSAALMGSILVIISVALGLSEFLTINKIPDLLVEWLASFELSTVGFLLMLNVMLIIVGCLMDIISALILFVPLIIPLSNQLGIDPIHLGLIFIVNLEIGYLTPPLGLNLFVASGFFQKPFGEVMQSVLPFIGALAFSLVIITAVPTISLGLVNMMHGRPIVVAFPTGKTLKPQASKEEIENTTPKYVMVKSEEANTNDADLEAMTDRTRVSTVVATGTLSDFDTYAERAIAVMTDGKHTRTIVVLTSDDENCGAAGSAPDNDEWLLRIEFQAGLKANTLLKLGKADLKIELQSYEGGKLTKTQIPESGIVVIFDPEIGAELVIIDPENEGQTLGLFGAFELKFGDDKMNGKFVPGLCEKGGPLYK